MTDLEKLISDFEKDGLTLTTLSNGFNSIELLIHNRANDKYLRRIITNEEIHKMSNENLIELIGLMKKEVQE